MVCDVCGVCNCFTVLTSTCRGELRGGSVRSELSRSCCSSGRTSRSCHGGVTWVGARADSWKFEDHQTRSLVFHERVCGFWSRLLRALFFGGLGSYHGPGAEVCGSVLLLLHR